MGTCDKCKKSITDNHCGCNHFDGLFGYNIDINKKQGSDSTDDTVNKIKNIKSPKDLKSVDLSKAKDSITSFLSGLKKPQISNQPQQMNQPMPQGPSVNKGGSHTGMIIGIVAALIIITVVFLYFKNKK